LPTWQKLAMGLSVLVKICCAASRNQQF
jgi:hypothetical protein